MRGIFYLSYKWNDIRAFDFISGQQNKNNTDFKNDYPHHINFEQWSIKAKYIRLHYYLWWPYKFPHHQNSDKFHQRYIAAMFVTIWPCSSGEYVYSWQLQSDDDDSISYIPFELGGLTKYIRQNKNQRLIQACVMHLIKKFNE